MNVNKVLLLGNAGRAAESIANGKGVKFSIAVNDGYFNDQKQWVEQSDWFDVVCWGKLAEGRAARIMPGDKVFVEGKIKIKKVETENGNRYYTEIVAARVSVDPKEKQTQVQQTPPDGIKKLAYNGENKNDDLPF